MALDTNIALGVRPVEQVNMLGQMGQMMQLRQANDEYQSNNALKDFYAQGGDLTKPEDQRKLMSTVGAKGADLIAKQFALQKTKEEVKKLGYDNVESEFKQSRGLLSSIDPSSPNAGAQLMAWHEANHRSPIMGSILAASGIDAASSRAMLQASIDKGPAGIREAIRRSSMGQADYQKELMQTERSHISAAPGHRQASIAEQRFKNELDFGGESKPFLIQDPNNPSRTIEVEHRRDKRTGQWVPMAIQPPSLSVNISPSSATATPVAGGVPNTLATAVGAAPVNASSPNMLNQNAAPVVAANVPAPALATVRGAAPVFKDIVDPTNEKRMITINVNEYKGGTIDSKGNRAPGVIGVAGKEPTAALREQKTIGAEDALKSELDNLRFAYGKLNEAKAIPSTERSGISNLSSSTQASDTGQFFGKVFGTTEQSLRDNIQSSNLRLLQSIKNATGMSAQELNSNMELKTWIDSLTNPKTAYETNIKNIDNIENFVKKRANRNAESSAPSVDASSPKVIKSEAEYNALPSGATYIDPDGVSRRKR
jgi:hypothetical protein